MVLSFNNTVLLVSMRARDIMSNAILSENFGKRAVFSTPVRFHIFNERGEITFNIKLELIKNSRYITFIGNWKSPSASTKVIKEGHVVFETYRGAYRGWAPNICVNLFKRTETTCVNMGKALLVAFGTKTCQRSSGALSSGKGKLEL
jgi:hypothetical protein